MSDQLFSSQPISTKRFDKILCEILFQNDQSIIEPYPIQINENDDDMLLSVVLPFKCPRDICALLMKIQNKEAKKKNVTESNNIGEETNEKLTEKAADVITSDDIHGDHEQPSDNVDERKKSQEKIKRERKNSEKKREQSNKTKHDEDDTKQIQLGHDNDVNIEENISSELGNDKHQSSEMTDQSKQETTEEMKQTKATSNEMIQNTETSQSIGQNKETSELVEQNKETSQLVDQNKETSQLVEQHKETSVKVNGEVETSNDDTQRVISKRGSWKKLADLAKKNVQNDDNMQRDDHNNAMIVRQNALEASMDIPPSNLTIDTNSAMDYDDINDNYMMKMDDHVYDENMNDVIYNDITTYNIDDQDDIQKSRDPNNAGGYYNKDFKFIPFTEEQRKYINEGKSMLAKKCRRRHLRRMLTEDLEDLDVLEILRRAREKTKKLVSRQHMLLHLK